LHRSGYTKRNWLAKVGQWKLGESIESQFQKFINDNTVQSWEFYRMETVHAYVKAGCLASLFGKKDEVMYQDVAVFRKQKQ
jgi:hypothetical protein